MARRRTERGLTRRQAQVLALVSDGLSNREIGAVLGVTEACVKFHLAALFRHYGVDSRVLVAVRAAVEGARRPTAADAPAREARSSGRDPEVSGRASR